MSALYNFYQNRVCIISTVLLILLIRSSHAVISLQLPGLTYGGGQPTTVNVEFVDQFNNPNYILKGEVFLQSAPMQANSIFFPYKLTGQNTPIQKIRIKAGESGMILKLFDSPTASVPKLVIMMKEGFMMEHQPIDIPVMLGDSHQANGVAEINWYNRDFIEMNRVGGFIIGKVEIHVERAEDPSMKPKLQYIPFAQLTDPKVVNSFIYPESLIESVNYPKVIAPGVAVVGKPSDPQGTQFALNSINPLNGMRPNSPLLMPQGS